MTKTKKKILYVIMPLVAVSAAVIFAEVLLHSLPTAVTNVPPRSNFYANDLVGFTRHPLSTHDHVSACVEVRGITHNKYGYRDVAWPQSLKGGVALIGDSFLEGYTVKNDDTVAAELRRLLPVPIAAAGVSSLGTAAELAIYQHVIRSLAPKVVVLFLYPENDFLNTDCAHQGASDGRVRQICSERIGEDISIRTDVYHVLGDGKLKEMLKEYCFLCRIGNQVYQKYLARATDVEKNGTPNPHSMYLVDQPKQLQSTWAIMGQTLASFRDMVAQDNAELVIAIVPSVMSVSPDWINDLQHELGERVSTSTYDVGQLRRKVSLLAEELGIRTIDLSLQFRDYQRAYELPYPYLSYFCDGHWNPLGHMIAARSIADYLSKQELLDHSDQESITPTLDTYSSFRIKSPQTHLGTSSFQQIYIEGKYVVENE